MRRLSHGIGRRLSSGLVLCAQLGAPAGLAGTAAAQTLPPPPVVQDQAVAQPTQPEPLRPPPTPMPATPPPMQTGQVIAPPQGQAGPAAPAPASPADPGGQWVFTSQYGWLWMPYAPDYTYVAADSSAAYLYAYYPVVGWRWVYAPWILGWGPSPYWGRLGPARFAWYSRPWFRVGVVHRGGFTGGHVGRTGGGHFGGGHLGGGHFGGGHHR